MTSVPNKPGGKHPVGRRPPAADARRVIGVLLSVAVAAGVLRLSDGVVIMYDQPPVWLIALAVAAVWVLRRAIPTVAWFWWMAGLLTYLWSLTPGNTLVNGLWEIFLLAGLAAGRFEVVLVALNVGLLLLGLSRALPLNMFGIPMYASGSIHYVMGAQALVLIPVSFVAAVRATRRSPRWAWMAVLALSSYAALISGARAVYLPLLMAAAVTLWRTRCGAASWRRILVTVGVVVLSLIMLDVVTPGHPFVQAYSAKIAPTLSSLPRGLTGTGSEVPLPEEPSTPEQGALGSRLLMWDQAVRIGWAHPLGVGAGSFRGVISSFVRYPSVNFSSAHNYLVETFATGGWLRLVLLVWLLVIAVGRAWRDSADWPWSVACLAVWATTMFDVTGYYPGVMALAFLVTGRCLGRSMLRATPAGHRGTERDPRSVATQDEPGSPITVRARGALVRGFQKEDRRAAGVHLTARSASAIAGLGLAVLLALWWYLPCTAQMCAITRYRGVDFKVLPSVARLDPAAGEALLHDAEALNPRSLWVRRAQLRIASTKEAQLTVLRAVARDYPLANPGIYSAWAQVALSAGRPREARTAALEGLQAFPRNTRPAGVPIVSRGAEYTRWFDEADEVLERTAGRQGD